MPALTLIRQLADTARRFPFRAGVREGFIFILNTNYLILFYAANR